MPSNPTQQFSSTVRTGGDAPTGQSAISAGVKAGAVARGFLIVTDGQFNYTTQDGDVITDASETWALNVQHAQCIVSIQAGTTAVGKLFY
jgi:hypothetical protein